MEMSTHLMEGVFNVKEKACEKLLQHRVEVKLKGKKIGENINRLHLAQPQPRDNKLRPVVIPESVKEKRGRMQTEEKQEEEEMEEPEVPLWLRNFNNKEWKSKFSIYT